MGQKARRIPNRNKQPETIIGYLLASKPSRFSSSIDNSEIAFETGQHVPVARAVVCANGLVMFRVFGALTWVSERDGFEDINNLKLAANLEFVQKQQNEFNVYVNHGKHKTVAKDVPPTEPNNKNDNLQGKSKHMDKNQLRSVFSSLTAGQSLEINFGGPRAHLSGTYRVERTRTGRGKGGSRLVDMVRDSDGLALTTGTPDSNSIVNLVVGGERIGLASESELPVVFGRNKSVSNEFKRVTRALVDLRARGTTSTVTVESDIADFAGTFTVTGAQRCRGRGGPCRLDLSDASGRSLTLWSSKHSGAIRSISIVPVTSETTSE